MRWFCKQFSFYHFVQIQRWMQQEKGIVMKGYDKVSISKNNDNASIEMEFNFNVSGTQLINIFEQISQQLNFQVIEKQSNLATCIRENKSTIMSLINCLNWNSNSNMTAIKMTIHTNEKKSKRICKIRGLVGSKASLKQFVDLFLANTNSILQKKSILDDSINQANRQLQNPFHLQTCAAYMFNRILSDHHYGIGNTISSSLKHFQATYSHKNCSRTQSKDAVKFIMSLVNSTVQTLYQNFNYGRPQTQEIMPYCRVSVEKYIFQHLYLTLMSMYLAHTSEFEQIIINKEQKIFKNKSLQEILRQINLAEEVWQFIIGVDEQKHKQVMNIQEWRSKININKAIQELEKLSFSKNPREKIKHCQLMYTTLKTLFYEFYHGKKQLGNIQDVLPLTILVIMLSSVKNLKAEIDMLVDFSSFDSYDNIQSTPVLLHIQESLNFIAYEIKL